MKFDSKMLTRISVYFFGLLLLAIGSNLSITTNLGVSPVNSVPYTISVLTSIELSLMVPIIHGLVVVVQGIVLGKEFKVYYLLEVLFVIVFGIFIGLTDSLTVYVVPVTIVSKIFVMMISLFLIALGVSFYVNANLLNMPVEAVALALSQKYSKIHFHNFKMFIDCVFVGIAIVLGFVFNNEMIGIGVGTVIAAIFVGRLIPYTNKIAIPVINKLNFNNEV